MMFCLGLAIMCGAIGYLGSSAFVKRIYRCARRSLLGGAVYGPTHSPRVHCGSWSNMLLSGCAGI